MRRGKNSMKWFNNKNGFKHSVSYGWRSTCCNLDRIGMKFRCFNGGRKEKEGKSYTI